MAATRERRRRQGGRTRATWRAGTASEDDGERTTAESWGDNARRAPSAGGAASRTHTTADG